MGMLLGKAIFDRISINCPLDKTILRQIISEPIHMNDVYSYDMKVKNYSIFRCFHPGIKFSIQKMLMSYFSLLVS
jgi:hypothetical protein